MEPQSAPPLTDRASIEDIVIRAARLDDCEGISALADLPGYRWGTLSLPYQPPQTTRKRLEADGPGNVSLVVELNGRIIGNGRIDCLQGRRAHVGVLGIGLHDAFQGRGIGTRLMQELLSVADNWLNLSRIELTVYADNAPAIALYQRHGFALEGTHRAFAFRGGSFADAHAMARLKA